MKAEHQRILAANTPKFKVWRLYKRQLRLCVHAIHQRKCLERQFVNPVSNTCVCTSTHIFGRYASTKTYLNMAMSSRVPQNATTKSRADDFLASSMFRFVSSSSESNSSSLLSLPPTWWNMCIREKEEEQESEIENACTRAVERKSKHSLLNTGGNHGNGCRKSLYRPTSKSTRQHLC